MGDSWQSTHNDTGPSRDREKPRPRRMCAGSNHTSHETKGCPRVLTELPPVSWTSKLKSREWEAFRVCGSGVEA